MRTSFVFNSDVVEMASNAPLFLNVNDQRYVYNCPDFHTWSDESSYAYTLLFCRRFNPDAIVFDSSKVYGTPTYWMQHFFKESNGAIFLDSTLQSSSSSSLAASAISWTSAESNRSYIRVKVGNSIYTSTFHLMTLLVHQKVNRKTVMIFSVSYCTHRLGCELRRKQREFEAFGRGTGQEVCRGKRVYIDYTNIK